jgi:hypothetical protein
MDQTPAAAQFAALKNLAVLYGSAVRADYAGPLELDFPDADALRQAAQEAGRERAENLAYLRQARRALLEARFPSPDSWLSVDPIGELSAHCGPDFKLIFGAVDQEAIRAVCQQMHAALLRLQVESEAQPNGRTGRQGRKAEYDPARDRKLARDWAAAFRQGTYKADFAREKGLTTRELNRLLARERARKQRAH